MIQVSKDNWTLKVEWIGYGLKGGVQAILTKTLDNGFGESCEIIPWALVRDYNPSDPIQDEARDMPTEEEAYKELEKAVIREKRHKHLFN